MPLEGLQHNLPANVSPQSIAQEPPSLVGRHRALTVLDFHHDLELLSTYALLVVKRQAKVSAMWLP